MATEANPGAARNGSQLHSSVAYRVVTLLELLSSRGNGVGVREAARETGIDRSAVSRLLAQLEQLGWVEQVADRGVYATGPRLFSVAAAVRAHDSLWNAARPILNRVVARHNETGYLAVRQGDRVVYREKVECTQPIRYVLELGSAFPLATGAAGRAILSALGPEDMDRVLAEGLKAYTEQSITSEDEYRQQLRRDRELGYTVSLGGWVKNGGGIAAPFFDSAGNCAGALTLSAPADRLTPDVIPDIGRTMRDAGRELSRRLGYDGEWK